MKTLFTSILVLAYSLLFAKPNDASKLKNESGFIKNEGQIYDQNGHQNKQVLFLFTSPSLSVQLRDNGFSYELRQAEESKISMLSEPNFDAASPTQKTHRIDIDFVGSNSLIEKVVCEQNAGVINIHSKQNARKISTHKTIKRILYKNVYPQTDIEFLVTEIDGQARFKYNIILHPGADESKVQFLIEGASKSTLTKEGSIAMQTTLGVLEEQVPLSYELTKQGKQGGSIGARFRQISERLFGLTVDAKDRHNTLVIDPLAWGTYLGGGFADYVNDMCLDSLGNVYIGGYTNSISEIATVGAYQSTIGGGQDVYFAKYSAAGILQWCTYLGGDANDFLTDIKLDKSLNLYLVGTTNSSIGIATAGAYKTTLSGTQDGFVAKFTSQGVMVWSTYFGGNGTESFEGVSVDVFGDVLVSGYSNSNEMKFTYPNIHQDSIRGTTDIVLIKFNPLGNVVWATYYGGSANEAMNGICTDLRGNIYIGGITGSFDGIATAGAHQMVKAGGNDGLVAKFNSIGALQFGTYFGGLNTDLVFDLDVDKESNLLVVGYTGSLTGIAKIGSYDTSFANGSIYDAFLFKMDTTGLLNWSTYYGGDGTDYLYAVTSDVVGNIYAIGFTNSNDEIASVGAQQNNRIGTGDGYLISFSKTGARLSGTYIGGNVHDVMRGIELDKMGNMYLSGHSSSDSGIATVNGYDTINGGSLDAFVLRYDNFAPSVLGNNIIGSDQGLCLGNAAAVLTGTMPTGGTGNYTYIWTYSTNSPAGSYSPAPGINNTSSYSPGVLSANTWYRRTVFSGTEIHTSNVVSIAVSSKLNAGFITNKMIQCDRGNNFVFTDTTQAGNPAITRTWDFGNGKYSGNATDSMSYTFGTENTFLVTLINSINGACSDTASIRIYLIPNPAPVNINGNANVIRGTTETYSVTPTNGSTYSWMYDKGVGFSSTASINIRWTDLGTTELKLLERTGGGCYGDTAYLNITIDKPLGGSELAWDNDLLLYPNPSNGKVFIQDGLNRNLAVSVQSILGEQVYQGKAQLDGSLDLNHLSSGIYLIKLISLEGETFMRRIEISK